MRDLFIIKKLDDIRPIEDFQSFVFSLLKTNSHSAFSQELIKRHESDQSSAGRLQDEISNSQEFKKLVNDKRFISFAAELMSISEDDVMIVYPHFRIDLPSRFAADKKKISLPWHQEAGYYIDKGDCTPDSIVMSMYLHDCEEHEGALHMSSSAHSRLLEHSKKFMDPDREKFLRAECEEPEDYVVAESELGQVVAFDFKRPHRSGVNNSPKVRLTLLLRATSASELDAFVKLN